MSDQPTLCECGHPNTQHNLAGQCVMCKECEGFMERNLFKPRRTYLQMFTGNRIWWVIGAFEVYTPVFCMAADISVPTEHEFTFRLVKFTDLTAGQRFKKMIDLVLRHEGQSYQFKVTSGPFAGASMEFGAYPIGYHVIAEPEGGKFIWHLKGK